MAWVALLRAVNLGARNKMPMGPLRALFERAGCDGVRTYLQSGNVVFEHPDPDAAALEKAIAAAFGVVTTVVLRTGKQMTAVADAHPFGRDTSHSHVAFPVERLGRRHEAALAELQPAAELATIVRGEIVLRYPSGVRAARLTPALLEKRLGVTLTARNWRTVTALAELSG